MINPDCKYLEETDTSYHCTYNGQHCIAQDGFDCDVYAKLVCPDKVERKV